MEFTEFVIINKATHFSESEFSGLALFNAGNFCKGPATLAMKFFEQAFFMDEWFFQGKILSVKIRFY